MVAFNLGYLPGAADKRLTTATATTVAALEAALEVQGNNGAGVYVCVSVLMVRNGDMTRWLAAGNRLMACRLPPPHHESCTLLFSDLDPCPHNSLSCNSYILTCNPCLHAPAVLHLTPTYLPGPHPPTRAPGP